VRVSMGHFRSGRRRLSARRTILTWAGRLYTCLMVCLLEERTHGMTNGAHICRHQKVMQGTKHPVPVVASTFFPYVQHGQNKVRQQDPQSSKQPQRVAFQRSIWLFCAPVLITVAMFCLV